MAQKAPIYGAFSHFYLIYPHNHCYFDTLSLNLIHLNYLYIMKKSWFILALFASFLAFQSCGSNKEGCPINDDAHVKMNSRGELPTKGGKSSLFSKKMKKKMRS